VTIVLVGRVLLGAVLGRFFKVLVLVPAVAFALAVVLVRSADGSTACCARFLNSLR
jgi:hypothetical protein